MNGKKIVYMNIAKGLGIIFVVMGHAFVPFYNFLYMFHMALFFFISGYFYKDKYSSNPGLLIKKRLKTLYLPYIKYMIIFVLFHNIFMHFNLISPKIDYGTKMIYMYSIKDYIANIIKVLRFGGGEPFAVAFWFFRSLFLVNIIFCLITFLITKLNIEYKSELMSISIFILFAIGNLVNFLPNHKSYVITTIGTTLVALLIYYLGYLYKRYEKHIKINILSMIFSFGILIIDCFYGHIEMASNTYPSPAFFLLNSILGIYLIMGISKLLEHRKIVCKILSYIGENTIIIMALHILAFKIVNLIEINVYNYPVYKLAESPVLIIKYGWWILYSVVGVVVPICIKYMTCKIAKIIKNIFKSQVAIKQ